MILELVTFKAPHGASWQSILDDAKTTVPRWRANADLVRKHYLLSDDGRTCAGLYIWPTRVAAEQAHDAEWRAAVAKRTGAKPDITYFDLMMVLDNEAGTLTEWSESGEPRTSILK
jgi:hypothetical protein